MQPLIEYSDCTHIASFHFMLSLVQSLSQRLILTISPGGEI